jgi:WD40 repeat protein
VASIIESAEGNSSSLDVSETIFQRQAPGATVDVAFSPDGERIAAFAPNTGIIIWEVDSEEQVLEIPEVTDLASSIAFSPDGKFLAGGSSDLGTAIWDVKTGEEILFFPESAPITHVAFSKDDRTMATSAKNGIVSLWDMETRALRLKIFGQSTGFNFLALSSDGEKVAVGNDRQSTSIWDVSPSGGGEVLTIAAHEGKAHDAIYDPAGKRIASTGEDGGLRVWDAATGELLHSLPAQRDWVHFPAFSPDGKSLAAANQGGDLTIWDVNSGREITTMINDGPALTAVTFSPDGSRLAAGGLGGKAHIWDVATNNQLTTINNADGLIITEMIFSQDGKYVYTYDWQGWSRSWKSDTGEHLTGKGGRTCEATLWDGEASSDGRLQAVAAFDGMAYVFRNMSTPGDVPKRDRCCLQ